MSGKLQGYMLGALGAASYGLNPLFALPLYEAGMTADGVLFFRYLFALPVLAAMILLRGRSFRITRQQALILIGLGMLVALSSLTLFLAYNYMDAGIASTILFVYPIMVAVIMAAFYRERVNKVTIACIAAAMAGIGLLYHGDGETLSAVGTLLSLGSALTYALYIVWVNKSAVSRVATLAVTFYVLLFGVSLFAVRLWCAGTVATPPASAPWLWLCLVGLAVFPTAISFGCTTAAINKIGSTPTAILGALEPVTAVIIGVAVFGEQLTPRIIIGLLMIIGAVSMVIAAPTVASRVASIRRMFPSLRRRRH